MKSCKGPRQILRLCCVMHQQVGAKLMWLVETLAAHTHVHVHWCEPFGLHQENTSNKIMGLNQYLDRMNTKTSFILILGALVIEANRKSPMESRGFHAKRLFWLHFAEICCMLCIVVTCGLLCCGPDWTRRGFISFVLPEGQKHILGFTAQDVRSFFLLTHFSFFQKEKCV